MKVAVIITELKLASLLSWLEKLSEVVSKVIAECQGQKNHLLIHVDKSLIVFIQLFSSIVLESHKKCTKSFMNESCKK